MRGGFGTNLRCHRQRSVDEGMYDGERGASQPRSVQFCDDTIICHHFALHLQRETGSRYADLSPASARRPTRVGCYTHRLSENTLLQVPATCHAPQLLKHTPLLRLPVPLAPVLKQPVEVCLSLLTPFLNRRDEILFVCVTKIACDIGVLQRLQRCKGCGCIQMRDRIRQSRRIDLCLCK